MNRAIIWFRQDLRLHDNEAIVEALKYADQVLFVYVFDDKFFKENTSFGFKKTDALRAKFIIESVEDLRKNLKLHGAELVVRVGKAEDIIFNLAHSYKSSWVYCNRERTRDELEIQDELERRLWTIGQEIRYTRGKMLYYTQDLPFPITHTPDSFVSFRKEVERIVPVRLPLEVPLELKSVTADIEPGEMPNLTDLDYKNTDSMSSNSSSLLGGENAGLSRLRAFLWDTDQILDYFEKKNCQIGPEHSSKFSAYLAQGCLSPKLIYHEIKRYEEKKGGNQSTYQIIVELLWRDYFRLIGKKYGEKIFLKSGPLGIMSKIWSEDMNLFHKWSRGETGIPFIDANMRELNATGFLSHRARQNVAGFLINDLNINWQMGAEYFESVLIDYDICSNWCNWNYIAGISNDTKEHRNINILTQAKRYDPKAEYIRQWVPEISSLPDDYIFQPENTSEAIQLVYKVIIGRDYPYSILSSAKLT
ncbi:MAG TPA: DASH family cryptochrome [Saprospiraceae bacterium]|nr:DASH family cryptochrome [Saprospiraceae bacterium]